MTTPVRELTMQDRLLVAAHVTMLAQNDPPLQVIADTIIDSVRCCDFFPECAHVVDESERVDREEGRPSGPTDSLRTSATAAEIKRRHSRQSNVAEA